MTRYKNAMCSMLVAIGLFSASARADSDELQRALSELLNNDPAKQLGINGRRLANNDISRELLAKYQQQAEGLRPLWVSDEGPVSRARIALDVLGNADREGLRRDDYQVDQITALWSTHDMEKLARLEVLLSYAVAAYAADAREGRADPAKLDSNLFATARDVKIDPVELAVEAVNAPELREFLALQAPGSTQYRRLREALQRYRDIARQGGWTPVESGETLRPGMSSPRVPQVRNRLLVSGDLIEDTARSEVYDERLESAVKQFQKRHRLDIDGAIGKRTIAALNIPVDALVRRIIINMERWRWLDHDLGQQRLLVNIAGFRLIGTENEEVQIEMPVIVGKKYHMTPVFSGAIKYLEINPYWNIPVSIAEKEMYPQLLRNPYYLRNKNIRVFSGWGRGASEVDSVAVNWRLVGSRGMRRYKLRQDPGKKNSLGRIKFIFPNEYDVYLHDTPAHGLFRRSRRAFSHGCIRVSQPLQLASYLLGGEANGWPLSRIEKIVASGKRKIVKLENRFPVHLIYRTATVGDDGLVYFADDVYGRDRLLAKALF